MKDNDEVKALKKKMAILENNYDQLLEEGYKREERIGELHRLKEVLIRAICLLTDNK